MSTNRRIPSLMFSQHPDHAQTPYWHTQPYIHTHDEIAECLLMFQQHPHSELMWDWEGKLVDESVIEKLLAQDHAFFSQHALGKDLFLTFRVPNPDIESGYRLARAFMVLLSSQHLAKTLWLHTPPLFELILPMTTHVDQLIRLQENYLRIARATHDSFGSGNETDHIEIIPLFEDVNVILNSANIVDEYIHYYRNRFHAYPTYVRPFCARSDPALNSGIIATTVAIRWALSSYAELEQKTGVPLYPIIAPGALPFRGGLRPDTYQQFLTQFPGVKTIMIQSAFRYDFDQQHVRDALQNIQNDIANTKPEILPAELLRDIQTIIALSERPYRNTVERMAPYISRVAHYIPKRRERVQHIGLFGYSRSVGTHTLPRAIGFTGSCYSLGIPPEFFGLAEGIQALERAGLRSTLDALYPSLRDHIRFAGNYVNRRQFDRCGMSSLQNDIAYLESFVGEPLGPHTQAAAEHETLVDSIWEHIASDSDPTEAIERAAVLRQSMG